MIGPSERLARVFRERGSLANWNIRRINVDEISALADSQSIPTIAGLDYRTTEHGASRAKTRGVADPRLLVPTPWDVEPPGSIHPVESIVAGLVEEYETCRSADRIQQLGVDRSHLVVLLPRIRLLEFAQRINQVLHFLLHRMVCVDQFRIHIR